MGDKPSMVVMLWPATAATGNWQERTATPSRCTVQAPHRPMPQPNLVPVSFKWSRNTHNKGMEGDVSIQLASFAVYREFDHCQAPRERPVFVQAW